MFVVVVFVVVSYATMATRTENKIHYLDVEKGVTKHPLKPVVPLDSSDEDSESTDGGGYSKRHNYTHSDNENEVVKRASEENGTLLWANRRQVGGV